MGQSSPTSSSNVTTDKFLPDSIEIVHEKIFRHGRLISEIALLTYDDFVNDLAKLNALSRQCLNVGGKHVKFAIKKGSDNTVLWKGTVRIVCIKIDSETNKQENYRLLTLVEFLRILKTLQCQLSAAEQSSSVHSSDKLTASTFLDTVDDVTKADLTNTECCICLERKHEVILPCTHSYCLFCIEQWNVNNKTCPICRETLTSTDDTWILPEVPEAEEISEEIRTSLMKLVDDKSSTSLV